MTVLTPPLLVAALVLCVAGIAKLRSPGGAVAALAALGIVLRPALIRAFAAAEIAVGLIAAVNPGRIVTAVVACLYALFSGLSLLLARQRASCGCFGDREDPASELQSLLSGGLALVAIAASAWPPPAGIGWAFQHLQLGAGVAFVVGLAGAVYASVVAYTDLPSAWSAWSAR